MPQGSAQIRPYRASDPTLLAVAHGTKDPRGLAAVEDLMALVASLRPELEVRLSWLDHAEPTVRALAAAADRPFVAVPLLLSTGYHVRSDIPKAVAMAPVEVTIAHRLGPHPLLVEALADRLAEAGWTGRGPAQLVLVAAGSSHPAARYDVDEVAALVSARYGLPVSIAFAAAEPGVHPMVQALRASSSDPVVVVNYLLGPGQFADKVAACGAHVVPAPLGAHPAVAQLILDRYDAARTEPTRSPT